MVEPTITGFLPHDSPETLVTPTLGRPAEPLLGVMLGREMVQLYSCVPKANRTSYYSAVTKNRLRTYLLAMVYFGYIQDTSELCPQQTGKQHIWWMVLSLSE